MSQPVVTLWKAKAEGNDLRLFSVRAEDWPGRYLLSEDEDTCDCRARREFDCGYVLLKGDRTWLGIGLTRVEAVELEQTRLAAQIEQRKQWLLEARMAEQACVLYRERAAQGLEER
jgi:hypothetical protein